MPRPLRLAVLLAAFFAPLAAAQPTGTCAPGTAQGVLDRGDVRATLFNTGALFYGGGVEAAYVVPRGSGLSPLYAGTFWLGGKVADEVRTAATPYASYEFWPGPLEAGAVPPADCAPYDRIWVVSRTDVARYNGTGQATADLREWPHHLGAPVLDGDGDPTNYDLAGGDQPAIAGDQMAWWVMNDAGNAHATTGTPPLGVEVRVSAITSAHPNMYLRQATWYRYAITNRSDQPIDSLYASLWLDADLGDAADDYIGADTTRQMAFTYNADNNDGGAGGYGTAPPAIGAVLLQGPVGLPNGRDDDDDGETDEPGERLGMTANPLEWKSAPFPIGVPSDGQEYYYTMQGLWRDGTPMTEGGQGYPPDGPETAFSFPGDPLESEFWSEVNSGSGANSPGDRRMALSTGPFRLGPGETEVVVFALPFARGTSNMDSVRRLRAAAEATRLAYEGYMVAPSRVEGTAGGETVPQGAVRLSRVEPNPVRRGEALRVRLETPNAVAVRAVVVDVLGRRVATLQAGALEAGAHELTAVAAWPAGAYVVAVEVGTERRSLSFTVVP